MVTLYVLIGERDKRYVGITNNLERRMQEHESGRTKSGQLIGDFRLLHTEKFEDYASARNREKFLKSGVGRKWLALRYPRTRSAKGG